MVHKELKFTGLLCCSTGCKLPLVLLEVVERANILGEPVHYWNIVKSFQDQVISDLFFITCIKITFG